MNFADRMKEQTAEQTVTITKGKYAKACTNAMERVLDDVGELMETAMPMNIWMHLFKLYAIAVRDELFGGNDE